MNILELIYSHWREITAIGAVTLSSGVHAYQIIVQAGGLKNIWKKFLNGARDSETPTKPAEPQPMKTDLTTNNQTKN